MSWSRDFSTGIELSVWGKSIWYQRQILSKDASILNKLWIMVHTSLIFVFPAVHNQRLLCCIKQSETYDYLEIYTAPTDIDLATS